MAHSVASAFFGRGHWAGRVPLSHRQRGDLRRCRRRFVFADAAAGCCGWRVAPERRLARDRRAGDRHRFADRQAQQADALRRHRCRKLDPYFLAGLHEGGSRLPALLRFPEPLHFLDARHRAGRQLRDDVHLLGIGRHIQLSADRLLVRETQRGRCRQEGVPHQPRRRFRVFDRHSDGLDRI